MAEFTAIVPIDLVTRPEDILRKSLLLAEAFSSHGAKIVFAHNDRGMKGDKRFIRALGSGQFDGITVQSGPFYDGVVNPSLLRNIAAPLVTTEVMLLLDVDIWPDMELFQRYANAVDRADAPFYMLPCLYLTKLGSEKVVRGELPIASLKEQYYRFSRKYFLHLASPSSVTFMTLAAYQELNGFDERYAGHGYEDFDFMIRLALHYKVINKTADFMVNAVARSPLFAKGYRRELGRLVLPALMKKDLVYHLFHQRGERVDYSRQREQNFKLFQTKNASEPNSGLPADSTLLTAFVTAVGESGGDVADYGIYFENKPGHVDRFDTFRRRLRFLFNV